MTYLLMLLVCLVSWFGSPTFARACSIGFTIDRVALPRSGATDVSTNTSIIVLSRTEPFGLDLKVNGAPVPLDGWIHLGAGYDDQAGPTDYWRLVPAVEPDATYLLSWANASADGGVSELTQFTTGPGYDKTPGTAPTLRGMRLWRVRYPLSEVQGGNCIFSEYSGFITIDYDPAIIPKTDARSVVHSFYLRPKTGGAGQTFVYTGATPYAGVTPEGDLLHASPFSRWQPELDPSRKYCLTIGAFGDGDLARLTPASSEVCAQVTEIAAPGASLGTGGTAGTGGGCSAVPGAAPGYAPASFALLLVLAARRRRRNG